MSPQANRKLPAFQDLGKLKLLALPKTERFCFPLILAFVCLCVAGGQASAQVNLLPRGDFKDPAANTGWAKGFNVADLTVTPHLTAATGLADAELPAGMTLNWDKANIVTVNAKRAEVSLGAMALLTRILNGAQRCSP